MNQRAHIRHPANLTGRLTVEGQGNRQCRVADFCLGGVLVHFIDQGQAVQGPYQLAPGNPVALTVTVDGNRGQREITLPARVARTLDGAAGLQFTDPDPGDLLALQNHVRAHREQPVAQARPWRAGSAAVDAGPVVEAVRGVLRDQLTARMEEFLSGVRNALTESADAMVTNEDQHPWFAAIKTLEQSAESITREFLRGVHQPLETLAAGGAPAPEMDSGGSGGGDSRLSLVDKEMFEDWLTLKVMASRAEGRFHEQLLPLQLRFDEVFHISLAARQNPLHPATICSAFGQAIKPLGLNKRVERRVLEAFDVAVVQQLGGVYQRINNALVHAGVLPNLDVARYLSEHYAPYNPESGTDAGEAPAPSGQRADEPDPPPESDQLPEAAAPPPDTRASEGPAPEAADGDTAVAGKRVTAVGSFARQHALANQAYDAVRRIISRSRRAATMARAGGAESEVRVAPASVVSEALERLQRDPGAAPGDAPLQDRLQQAVTREMGGDTEAADPAALDDDVAAATEVIHHLFAGIADNPALSDRVRQAIRRLEVPFLRLLLTDEAFLHEDSHPARQMLNRIAQLGVRGDARLQDHEQAIDHNVQRILDNFSGDINVFSESLDNLDELCKAQEKLQQRNLKRVTETYEGRQQVVEARREVNRALERRIGGGAVPRALLTLVDCGWRQLLVQTLLREGRGSEPWHEYLGVLDRMMAAAGAMPDQEQLSRLLASIKRGLSRVDETQIQNQELVNELRRLLSVKVRQQEGEPPMSRVPEGMMEVSGAPDETRLSEHKRRWRGRARRYEAGDWFDLDDNGEHYELRLAWVDPDGELFVFVNHQGMKIQEFSLDELVDYLRDGHMRPIDSLDAPAVDRGLETMVHRVYSQMAHQVTHDELTGLLNRRELERRVRQRLENGIEQASLVHLDIDQFKLINNTAGPEAGDNLLRAIADTVHEVFPGLPTARLGGDEFAVWLEGVRPEAAQRSVESLKERVERQRFSPGGPVQAVTLSCGLVERQGAGDTVGNLMQAADSACQSAKEAGGNRVHRYQADDRQMAERDEIMKQAARLTEALDQDRLQLRCQRIEPMKPAARLPAYEVLIGVQGDNGELISPVELVQAAERYNRMHAVDRWVIAHVLRWMHAHQDFIHHVDHISINLSGHSLNDPSLTEFLFEQFHRYPVPRNRVCFEVTETTTISNLEDTADLIEALQALGCRFSLDDFGSGLASYGYLKHLPVDYIKIDGSFISDIADDEADQALVRSINEMGHLMGKETIAECVETEGIREVLRDIGVDYIQGFGVEKPRMLNSLASTADAPTGT